MQAALVLNGAAGAVLLLAAVLYLRPLIALARGNSVWRLLLGGGALAGAGLLLAGAPVPPEAPGALYLGGGLLLLPGFCLLASRVWRALQWTS
ncbi:MAG: hypothetical protein HY558_01325 [Euryarchaeota archaeon]|nr:hypothetical protein [Euryarchaeota archaeon]